MNYEIINRALWTIAIIGVSLALYWAANRLILARARAKTSELGLSKGIPTLLYFTTPACAPCKTVQRPAIQRLKQLMGECLQVIEIDASARPELASQWGVLSVPTTFVLDAQGHPQHVNHGVATAEKLLRQFDPTRG
jgi:thiol-disulfide isomerase/thioredoxin